MPIERDLHELLFAHDCVIVPRFGGFLTHYRPARIDERQRTIHPPAKDLSFNRHLVRTDGLLADHVARAEGLGFTQANAVIDGEVDAWHSKLDRDGRLELPRIGTFYRDAERKLQFDPDRRVNFLKDAYGLRPVAAIPCAVSVAAPVAARLEVDVPNTAPAPYTPPAERAPTPVIPITTPAKPQEAPAPRQTKPEYSFSWVAAAAVVALLSTAATWWVVLDRTPGEVHWGGFDPFHTTDSTPPQPVDPATTTTTLPSTASTAVEPRVDPPVRTDEAPTLTEPVSPTANTTPTAPEPTAARDVVEAVAETTAVAVRSPRARYHVIGGCFLQKDNADTFLANMRAKGFPASIIDQKGGLYRVAIGSYPDREVALDALAAVRKEEARAAWLLKQ